MYIIFYMVHNKKVFIIFKIISSKNKTNYLVLKIYIKKNPINIVFSLSYIDRHLTVLVFLEIEQYNIFICYKGVNGKLETT